MAQASIIFTERSEQLLERRGFSPGVKGSLRTRTAGVVRALELLDRLSTLVDPAQKLGKQAYNFAIAALFNAWSLGAGEIQTIEVFFRGVPNLEQVAAAHGVDLEDFFLRLAQLDFAERLALVDRAQQHHASR